MKNVNDCIEAGLEMIRSYKENMQAWDDGYVFNVDIDSCRWAIEQAILNRQPGQSMLSAVIQHVESVEYRADAFNGVEA